VLSLVQDVQVVHRTDEVHTDKLQVVHCIDEEHTDEVKSCFITYYISDVQEDNIQER